MTIDLAHILPHAHAKVLALFCAPIPGANHDLTCPIYRMRDGKGWWEATSGHALIRLAPDLSPRDTVVDATCGPSIEDWRDYAGMPAKWRRNLALPCAPRPDWPDTDFVWPKATKEIPMPILAHWGFALLGQTSKILRWHDHAAGWLMAPSDPLGPVLCRPVTAPLDGPTIEVVLMPIRDGQMRTAPW